MDGSCYSYRAWALGKLEWNVKEMKMPDCGIINERLWDVGTFLSWMGVRASASGRARFFSRGVTHDEKVHVFTPVRCERVPRLRP